MFAPIDRVNVVESCARKLRGAILRGELAFGDRLPPERQLADDLGVGRTTLRGALTRLVAEGLVQVKQGSGYLVRSIDHAESDLLTALLDATGSHRERVDMTRDLLALRLAIARAVLDRIVTKGSVTPEAQENLASQVAAYESAREESAPIERLASLELDVLRAGIACASSLVFRVALGPVLSALSAAPALLGKLHDDPSRTAVAQHAFLAFVERPTREAADAILAAMTLRDEEVVARYARNDSGARSESGSIR